VDLLRLTGVTSEGAALAPFGLNAGFDSGPAHPIRNDYDSVGGWDVLVSS
jgi:hypothetical protein